MRINKYLASCGVGARRKCDELIQSGAVKINGQLAKLGDEVNENDKVTVNDKVVMEVKEYYYFVLNKPKGCVTTLNDDRGRLTVIDIFNKAYSVAFGKNATLPKVFPVGRLDYNTTGLLLLTNDGELANSLMHPTRKVEKTYKAVVYPKLTQYDIDKLQKGVIIDNERTLPAKLKVVKDVGNKQVVEITITQGRNRQVRKMFESVGKKVDELQRIAIGNLKLNNLKSGQIKVLTKNQAYSIL